MILSPQLLEEHAFGYINDFAESKNQYQSSNELNLIRKVAPAFREKFISGGEATTVHQFICSRAPYPTAYGFHAAYKGLNPFLYFNNKATLVQFKQNGKLKNFLFNPYFPELSKNAGFFAHISEKFEFIPQKYLLKQYPPIVDQLKAIGVKSEDIDYVSYDHLHVQDLRPLMGTIDSDGQPINNALFPNAYFVFHKDEWEQVNNLHPLNEIWYVKDGFEKLNTSKLLLYDGDLQIAPGIALIHTKGHTAGNHSMYINTTGAGTFTISENGVGPDGYNPEKSRINAIRETAKWKGWEVILNANTQDFAYFQYNSMIKEKLLSGDSKLAPGYANHRSSSEFTTWWTAPFLRPTFEFGLVQEGIIEKK